MLPQLRKLEREFRDALVVIGVHAGKYPNERLTAQIALAAERLGVAHPIVNDRQFRTWRRFAVQAWPTLVFLSPSGDYLGSHPGEASYDALAQVIRDLVADGERRGDLGRAAVPEPAPAGEAGGVLRFPTKIVAGPEGRLFIADTGHHRILVARLEGDGRGLAVETIIGTGSAGPMDGLFEAATFERPHGLAFDGATLFVADTGNHRIRAVDLETRTVRTVAGTGARGHHDPGRTVPAHEAALASPWDVALVGRQLYVAMAGSHQLWAIDLAEGTARPYAGSGLENIDDGILGGATLAQPSGLAVQGDRLYFVDAESSAVRWADLRTSFGERAVHTIVGTGLFDFGDRDGVGEDVRLQHPAALATYGDGLLIADTYNHRIKVVEPAERRVAALTDRATCSLNEPEGLLVLGDRLYVADTNHHRIVKLELCLGTTAGSSSLEVAVHIEGLERARDAGP